MGCRPKRAVGSTIPGFCISSKSISVMYSTRISVVVLFLSALVCDRYGVVKSMRGNIGLAQLGSCGRGMLLLLAIGCLRLTVAAQSFSNLNFESTAGLGIPADGIWLNWSLAAPGWHHPSGGDSVFVYHLSLIHI